MKNSQIQIPFRLWIIAGITGAGAFMAMLDSTVVNLAITNFQSEFNAPIEDVQWVITSYLIALAVSLTISGWLGRRFGQERIWIASVIGFCLTSLLCSLAGSLSTLIIARTTQGFAGGIMVPIGQAVLASNADRRQLGRLMGVVGFTVALGPALGPGFGGLLIEYISWRWLFGINVVVGFISLALAQFYLQKGKRNSQANFDKIGFTLASLGIPLLLFGLTEISSFNSDYSIIATTLGGLLILMYIHHALKAPSPLIKIRLLSIPHLATGVTIALFTGAAMYGGLLILPLYFQSAFNVSISGSGMLLLIMGLGSALALPVAGTLTDRFGAGIVSLAGGTLLVIGTVPFLLPVEVLSKPLLIIVLLVRGIGLALAQMPAITAVYVAVSKEDTGDAAVLVNITQRIGGALGAIGVVIVLDQFVSNHSNEYFLLSFLLLTIFAVSAFGGALAMLLKKA